MIKLIQDIAKRNTEISGYVITEKIIESKELFFIKKNLDMDRAKKVHHYTITVYVDYEEDGNKYTGSSNTKIHPTMDEKEIEETIHRATMAAKYVKNPYYPLVEQGGTYLKQEPSQFFQASMDEWMSRIIQAVYKNDIYDKGGINSCEIFLDKVTTHVINSNGVDVEDTNYKGMIEFITTWKEEGEEVELYRCLNFSDFDEVFIANEVAEMITICKEKAVAKSELPTLSNATVILTRDAVEKFFDYYTEKCRASMIYNQMSNWKIGDQIQGEEVFGDKITMILDPEMKNSIHSLGFDEDGFPLKRISIIEEGQLKNYIAEVRFAHYLDVKATGNILNMEILPGSKTLEELRKDAHLEIVAFSDFYMDNVTGAFGGEMRLAWYYEGDKKYPITGGSISGNILDVHKEMYFSKEIQKENNFIGPKAIQVRNISVTGTDVG